MLPQLGVRGLVGEKDLPLLTSFFPPWYLSFPVSLCLPPPKKRPIFGSSLMRYKKKVRENIKFASIKT